MNAKLCKKLRAQARAATVGKPLRQLLIEKHRAVDEEGKQYYTLLAVNAPDTFRGAYRKLKRGYIR